MGRPAIVFAPNKTLAAQLYSEFREFFPRNAVEYFVSYYDYYQPEAYVPQRDLFIEKDSSINEHIEQMRLSATKSLMERRDVVIVATVSAIYGIGNPSEYHKMILTLRTGDKLGQRDIIARLIAMQYSRNEADFQRGTFRVRGDTIDIFPAEHAEMAVRVELFDDEVETMQLFDPLTGRVRQKIPRFTVYPSSHYVTPRDTVMRAIETIKAELRERLEFFHKDGKLVEAQRLEQRTRFDLEMLQELGFCKGIENYSRHFSGAAPGEPPPTLVDYLPPDALMLLDESHVLIGQLNGMYNGDRARKENLVDYGFRLPSALDNRPLKFNEFERKMRQAVFVSATPADYEKRTAGAGGRATGASDRPRRSGNRGASGAHAGRRRARRDQRAREGGRARAGHGADQAHGRAADRVSRRSRRQGALPAQRYRHGRARRDHPRFAPRHLRRAGRDQPAARGAGYSGSVAGGDSRRRQGRFPARRALADPDDRPRCAQRERQGDSVRATTSRIRCAARSAKPSGAARSRSRFNLEMGITPRGVVKRIKDIIDGVYNVDDARAELKEQQTAREVRGYVREAARQGTQAPRKADDGARQEPRIRKGGADARPTGAAARARVRRERRRSPDRHELRLGCGG